MAIPDAIVKEKGVSTLNTTHISHPQIHFEPQTPQSPHPSLLSVMTICERGGKRGRGVFWREMKWALRRKSGLMHVH